MNPEPETIVAIGGALAGLSDWRFLLLLVAAVVGLVGYRQGWRVSRPSVEPGPTATQPITIGPGGSAAETLVRNVASAASAARREDMDALHERFDGTGALLDEVLKQLGDAVREISGVRRIITDPSPRNQGPIRAALNEHGEAIRANTATTEGLVEVVKHLQMTVGRTSEIVDRLAREVARK